MCKWREAIAEQTAAARELTRVCTARSTFTRLRADLLRDPSTLKWLPEKPADFDALIDQLDQRTKETKQ